MPHQYKRNRSAAEGKRQSAQRQAARKKTPKRPTTNNLRQEQMNYLDQEIRRETDILFREATRYTQPEPSTWEKQQIAQRQTQEAMKQDVEMTPIPVKQPVPRPPKVNPREKIVRFSNINDAFRTAGNVGDFHDNETPEPPTYANVVRMEPFKQRALRVESEVQKNLDDFLDDMMEDIQAEPLFPLIPEASTSKKIDKGKGKTVKKPRMDEVLSPAFIWSCENKVTRWRNIHRTITPKQRMEAWRRYTDMIPAGEQEREEPFAGLLFTPQDITPLLPTPVPARILTNKMGRLSGNVTPGLKERRRG